MPKAITAMARKLAALIYRMLKYGTQDVDKGMEHYEAKYRETRLQYLRCQVWCPTKQPWSTRRSMKNSPFCCPQMNFPQAKNSVFRCFHNALTPKHMLRVFMGS